MTEKKSGLKKLFSKSTKKDCCSVEIEEVKTDDQACCSAEEKKNEA